MLAACSEKIFIPMISGRGLGHTGGTIDKLESILDKIESRIRVKHLQEIPSQTLGKWILSELKKLDPVAYLRFASVYRTFSDPKDFKKEIETL